MKNAFACVIAFATLVTGCGYHAAGTASRLPDNLHVLAIPTFVNETQTYRVEQIFTRDVVREVIDRTHYRVVSAANDPDATLKATLLSAQTVPLTYDSQTGRISSALVTVSLRVSLVERGGRVLFENSNYTFREQYQVSQEVTSFFAEETPALQRMSRDFARTLVSDVLEAF